MTPRSTLAVVPWPARLPTSLSYLLPLYHHLLLLLLPMLLLHPWSGSCHPQCLDFKPPFEPRQSLVFCKEYNKFGCCDLEQDQEISIRFYTIMDFFDYSGFATCGKFIRSLLCQTDHDDADDDDDEAAEAVARKASLADIIESCDTNTFTAKNLTARKATGRKT
ncbi:hypothetical protein CRUP_014019 [Coryphaenoides rupestris]|nr:hypothetical protein CRUP_014019 [Coryphaenoides rupestris]